MKLSEALEKMSVEGVTRDGWYYFLKFSRDGYLTLHDYRGEISPYVISEHDFSYEWELVEWIKFEQCKKDHVDN